MKWILNEKTGKLVLLLLANIVMKLLKFSFFILRIDIQLNMLVRRKKIPIVINILIVDHWSMRIEQQ